jgi:hypothetical protein
MLATLNLYKDYYYYYYYYYHYYCPSNKHCPSARCAYAANAVGKDLDIFALGTISLNHIFTQQSKTVNNVCSYS